MSRGSKKAGRDSAIESSRCRPFDQARRLFSGLFDVRRFLWAPGRQRRHRAVTTFATTTSGITSISENPRHKNSVASAWRVVPGTKAHVLLCCFVVMLKGILRLGFNPVTFLSHDAQPTHYNKQPHKRTWAYLLTQVMSLAPHAQQ